MISECGMALFLFGNKRKDGKIVLADGLEEEYKIAERQELVRLYKCDGL